MDFDKEKTTLISYLSSILITLCIICHDNVYIMKQALKYSRVTHDGIRRTDIYEACV